MKDKQFRCGVVAIHGICGNPRLFDMFINDDTCVEMPVDRVTLSGHGGTALDFSRSSMRQWKQQVHEAVAAMRSRCDKVVIAGHSMGCLLVLEEGFAGNADGLFLLCPPLKLHLTTRMFINAAKVFFGISKDDPVIAAAIDAYGIAIDYNPLHFYGWIPRYLELFREIHRIDGMLHGKPLQYQAQVYLSGRDELVSPASDIHLKDQTTCEVTHLKESTHYYFTVEDRALLAKRFREFLECVC